MQIKKTDKIIKIAEAFLSKKSYDKAHGLEHHKRVFSIAKNIASNISENPDMNILKISCMWHDVIVEGTEKNHVKITRATADYLKRCMVNNGFTQIESQRAYLAVRHHEMGNKPMNIEGKILFDADKLDAFTPERSRWFAKSKKGRRSLWNLKLLLLKIGLVRYYVKKNFHFVYSKKLFDQRIKALQKNEENKT